MAKILRIDGCRQCPHHAGADMNGKGYCTILGYPQGITQDTTKVREMCPLEDDKRAEDSDGE